MNTAKLKTFAQMARRRLMEQVRLSLEAALLMEGAAAAENRNAISELKKALLDSSKEEVVERVAYTWFNRFCALRFLDANNYSFVRVLSPVEGDNQPEILAEAKRGIFREELANVNQQRVIQFLTGQIPSNEGQGEAYRLLLVGACNYYSSIMPYLFEKINDYSELLLPLDLLSTDSVLSAAVQTLDEETCQNVEVIGWLYQFYISEKKDAIFAAKQPVSVENIPAATQLFTPNWIVRYLVDNSLGRLWLLNRPNSRLKEQMSYYIQPESAEESFLKIKSPEELRVCDPAVGSGHMLVYAFDLLYAIYEEEGYPPNEIAENILRYNLYGIEIDERAGALAAFALTMKGRQRQRLFFRKLVQPNICVMDNIHFTGEELNQYVQAVGKNLFSFKLDLALQQFADAKHFGSLIRPEIADVYSLRETLEAKNLSGDLFLFPTHQKVTQLLKQIDFLSAKYHVVIANPPYMGSGAMNAALKKFAESEYKNSKADLFSMFMERSYDLVQSQGLIAMVTMHSWMFLSSFEKMRSHLINNLTILSMAHFGIGAFDTLNSKVVQTTAFVLKNSHHENHKGQFLRLVGGYGEAEKLAQMPAALSNPYSVATTDFKKIPSSPIAYWVNKTIYNLFEKYDRVGNIAMPRAGLATGDNTIFQRNWFEVSLNNISFDCSTNEESLTLPQKWYPCNSGGDFRKWFGNNSVVVNWQYDGYEIRNFRTAGGQLRSRPQNTQFYFKQGITWTKLGSLKFAARLREKGFVFDDTGRSAFPHDEIYVIPLLGLFSSNLASLLLDIFNPTMSYTSGDISNLPLDVDLLNNIPHQTILDIVKIGRNDWDSYESSWDFASYPLLQEEFLMENLAESYTRLRRHWREMTLEMQQLEQENNRIFIEAYGLQDELSPDVPLEEITLTCNPAYRYSSKKSADELESLLLKDTIKEFISYAVGCIFGRYSIDKDGLILANQGENLDHYLRQVPNPRFPADKDNVIPIMEEAWFNDDIVEKFKTFLACTFGEANYRENLAFIENALGRDLRSYFLRDFYDEHVRRYNKRPIYWLFSSPKGSFNVLIYMHRYAPDSLSLILNDYLREYRKKLDEQIRILEAQSINSNSSKADKTAALKGIEKYKKILKELDVYERDILYPLAAKQLEINLDDGVKVNYQKFGAALKPIAGLDSAE